jgi:hypothetical protein
MLIVAQRDQHGLLEHGDPYQSREYGCRQDDRLKEHGAAPPACFVTICVSQGLTIAAVERG